MSIGKRVKAIFAKPERKLTALNQEFRELRQALQRVAESRDPLTEVVHFFDIVSKWHDRGINDIIAEFKEVNYGQYDEMLKKLRTLQEHFVNAGRCEYGWNRTKPGEPVTAEKVFLGNIFGLWTKTVAYWKNQKDEQKGGWGFPGMDDLNAYDVVSRQARQFMASHTGPMIIILNDLEAAA